jgi:hypothetical protein
MILVGSIASERFFMAVLGFFVLVSMALAALACNEDRKRLRERERKRRDYWGYE